MPRRAIKPRPARVAKRSGIIDAKIARASRFFAGKRFVKLAGVYGSRATGKASANSDLDVAVACVRPLSTRERIALAAELADAVRTEVDLVDLRQIGGVLLEEVLRDIRWLKRKDSDLLAEIFKKQMYDRADFAPLREYILARKRERFLRS